MKKKNERQKVNLRLGQTFKVDIKIIMVPVSYRNLINHMHWGHGVDRYYDNKCKPVIVHLHLIWTKTSFTTRATGTTSFDIYLSRHTDK